MGSLLDVSRVLNTSTKLGHPERPRGIPILESAEIYAKINSDLIRGSCLFFAVARPPLNSGLFPIVSDA